jgi:hypothetical protein
MSLKIIEFIKTNDNWEEILSNSPYCLNISYDTIDDRKLVMFKYDQCNSDFAYEIVRECRGLILDITDDIIPVSIPYFKFFNYGEEYAANIDWESAIVSSKIDGSLIKVVKYNDRLLISTNGVIDAYKCNLPSQIGCPYNVFGELFDEAIRKTALKKGIENNHMEWFKSLIEPNITYMFELVSPYNQVVIPYNETKLYFHGMRDNISLNEIPFVNSDLIVYFDTPTLFHLRTLDDCVEAARMLPWDDEGYVVLDKYFNRIKIKSPEYVKIHRLAPNNGVLSMRRAVELFMENDYDEILSYFPKYRPTFDDLEKRFEKVIEEIESDYYRLLDNKFGTRKEQAMWIKKNSKYAGILFQLLDKGGLVREKIYLMYERSHDSILNLLGVK